MQLPASGLAFSDAVERRFNVRQTRGSPTVGQRSFRELLASPLLMFSLVYYSVNATFVSPAMLVFQHFSSNP